MKESDQSKVCPVPAENIRLITTTYEAKMSQNYQTAGTSASMVYELPEGEDAGEFQMKVWKWLKGQVHGACRVAIEELTAKP